MELLSSCVPMLLMVAWSAILIALTIYVVLLTMAMVKDCLDL